MHRSVSVPVLVATLATGVLLAGCGSDTGADQASDDTSSASTSPTSAPSSSVTSEVGSATPSPTTATSSADPVLADCASAWVDGQTLPFSYRGCLDGARTVTAQRQSCEMGKPLLTYRNSFWAVAGGPIHQVSGTLAKDAGWHRALVQCGG